MLSHEIIEKLKNISPIFKENSKNIIIRCPYCGDSQNPRSAHLYISKTDPPYPFHCFRAECEVKGTLFKLLKDLELLNELSLSTIKDLYRFDRKEEYTKINTNKKLKLLESNKKGIQYILDRLKLEKLPDWIKYHLVDLDTVPNKPSFINNNNYVGFKTLYGSKIVCRRIVEESNLPRYYHIVLEKKIDFFVTIPDTNIQFSSTKGKVILGEGIFDVLNYYLNKPELQKNSNVILVASLGKFFYTAYKFVIKKFLNKEWDLIFLKDSDVHIKYILRQLYKIKDQFYIAKNIIGKDFGETFKESIQLYGGKHNVRYEKITY